MSILMMSVLVESDDAGMVDMSERGHAMRRIVKGCERLPAQPCVEERTIQWQKENQQSSKSCVVHVHVYIYITRCIIFYVGVPCSVSVVSYCVEHPNSVSCCSNAFMLYCHCKLILYYYVFINYF